MKNKEAQASESGLSRRTLLKAGGTAMVVAAAGSRLLGQPPDDAEPAVPTTGEELTLSRVLVFWLAVTNTNSDLTIPISAATIEKVTGLKSIKPGDTVDVAIKYVNAHKATYDKIKDEFQKLSDAFAYTPGQCPKASVTLRKLADVDPNS